MKSKASLDAAIARRLGTARARRWLVVTVVSCLLLAPFAALAALALARGEPGGAMCASLPFLFLSQPLREQDGGEPDGGGGDDPLARRILGEFAAQKKEMERIEQTLGEHAETKREVEALHKSVRAFEGLDADVKTVLAKMAKLEVRLSEVRREVSGDPLARIVGDAEMRATVIAPAKAHALKQLGKAVPKEILEGAERMAAIVTGQRAVTGGSTPGSAYIDQELLARVYQLAASYGRWSGFDVLRPGARTEKIPVDTTDPSMVWMTEGTAPSEASYSGSQVSLAIKTLFGWISVSNEMLQDDEVGLANHLLTKFFRATAKKLDHAVFAADGTDDADHGDYEGIFHFGTAYDLGTGDVAIADIVFDDFVGLVAGADEALAEQPTTRWWMHPQILVQLLGIKDDNGRPIFLTGLEAPAAGGIGSILGYPVVTANAAPKTVAAEAPVLAFGDAMGLAVGLRQDMEFASSQEVQFTANKTVFRTVCRAGVKIKQATAFEVMTLGAAS